MRHREAEKYRKTWAVPGYGTWSPGLDMVEPFIRTVRPVRGSTITDFGTGSGKAAREFQKRGFGVRTVDLTRDGISRHRWRHLRDGFHEQCLWDMDLPKSRYGFCCDVMEHIPPEFTMLVVRQILDRCQEAFFCISTVPDSFGKKIGEPLHLTVMPYPWWRDRMHDMGTVLCQRDLMIACMFHVKAD